MDEFSKKESGDLRTLVRQHFQEYTAIQSQLEEEYSDQEKMRRELDFLSYQIKEICSANLIVGEDEDLERQYHKMVNSRKIMENLQAVYQITGYEEPMSAGNQIGNALHELVTAQQYDANSIAHTTIDGEVFGFASPGAIAKNEGLLIRKDWLDNLGLEVPTTIDELLEVARAFTFNDPDGNGRNDTYGYGAFVETDATLKGYPGSRLWPIMGAFGVEGLWSLKSGEEGLNIYKPEFYDFMVFLKGMCDEGIIDPNWLSYKKDDFRAAWKQGRFGMMYEQNAAYAATSNYAPFDKNFPDGEWIVIDAIKGPEGKAAIGAYDMNYRIYAVSRKAADAGKLDKICELLEWMSSDEGYYLLGWGVEGVNYVLDEDGIPVAGDLGDMAFTGSKGQVYTQLRNLVFYNGDVELASRYPTYITEVSKKEMSALKTLREMQAMTWTNAIGSGNLPTPNADVKRFYEQTLGEFLTGARPLNEGTWQEFIDGFNAIGGKAWNDEGVAYMTENGLLHD